MTGSRAGRGAFAGVRRQVWLVLRGLWWRRALTVLVLAVATVTVTAAALGPLYARAAGESTLNDHLTQASWRAGLHMSGPQSIGRAGWWPRLERAVPRPGQVYGYGRRIEGIRSAGELGVGEVGAQSGLSATVAWRQDECAHLIILTGRCPSGPGDALLAARSFVSGADPALYLSPRKWGVGTRLSYEFYDPNSDASATVTNLRIVGTYRPRDTADPFWFGFNYFDAHTFGDKPPVIDALFVSQATVLAIRHPAYAIADFDYPLTPAAVRLSNETRQRAAVAALIGHGPPGTGLVVQSGLGGVLASADGERRLLNVATLLVTLQLVLLAWLVLFQVAADAIEARGDEIAMAKLRGHGPVATLRFGMSEPLLLLAAAVPVGVASAWGVTHAFAARVFAAGSPVVLTGAPVVAAGVAFAGGVVAAGLAGYATLTRSVLDQWRRTTRRPGHGRLTVAVDAAVAMAAVVALVVLLGQHDPRGRHGPGALLTPGLLVLAVALVGVRVLPLACRGLARATRGRRRVGLFLASRQVSRRPVGLRLAALLAVAVGLATFAVAGESVATTNRYARADAELGADRVAAVQFVPGHDPVAATERADPGGRWAMATASWLPGGGGSVVGTVLGVDTRRLHAVAQPVSGGLGVDALARAAAGTPVPAIVTSAARIRVHLVASGLSGDTTPQLRPFFRTAIDPYVSVEAGHIHDGTGTYTAALPCAASCTLRGLAWDRPINAVRPMTGTIELIGIDLDRGGAWAPVDLHSAVPGSWRAAQPQGQASDRVTLSARGVRDEFGNENGGYGGITYGSDPSPIPAVATPPAVVPTSHPPQLADSSNTTVDFRVVARTRLVPVALTNGVVMDVRYLQTQLPTFSGEATWQIWLGVHAPPDALGLLGKAGLNIEHVHSIHARVTLLSRQGPALALLLLLACAVAGAALAAGATATSISANSRRRAYELAALRAVGVARGSLIWASLLEQLLLLGTGVVLGVPTGLIAARVAMPVIPEFSDLTPITLRYAPHLGPALLFAAAFIGLLTAVALIAARALIRAAIPSRLRAAE